MVFTEQPWFCNLVERALDLESDRPGSDLVLPFIRCVTLESHLSILTSISSFIERGWQSISCMIALRTKRDKDMSESSIF